VPYELLGMSTGVRYATNCRRTPEMSSRRGQVSAAPTQKLGPEAFGRSRETALWWLTNAGFLINSRGTLLMIDPVICLDPDSPATSETGMRLLVELPVEASNVPRLDAVLYTHADGDHFAQVTAEELMRTDALFIGPPPVEEALKDMGVSPEQRRTATAGESIDIDRVKITPTPADHPWQLRDPAKFGDPWGPGDCCGYAIGTPDGHIWCPGDTRLMDDHVQMQGVEVLLLDAGRNEYHLGVENAARLANILDVPHVIPYHYGTYDAPDHPAYNGDPSELAAKLHDAERRFHVLAPGEKYVLWGATRRA
jgi:L-ascorbate metabolism protein UlaG (beta-lactamase superfamily)